MQVFRDGDAQRLAGAAHERVAAGDRVRLSGRFVFGLQRGSRPAAELPGVFGRVLRDELQSVSGLSSRRMRGRTDWRRLVRLQYRIHGVFELHGVQNGVFRGNLRGLRELQRPRRVRRWPDRRRVVCVRRGLRCGAAMRRMRGGAVWERMQCDLSRRNRCV